MSQNRLWHLLAKKLSGEASYQEIQEMEQLIREHPEWTYAAGSIEELWKSENPSSDLFESELAYQFHLVRQKNAGLNIESSRYESINPFLSEPKRKRRGLLVASLLLIATIGIASFFLLTSKNSEENQTAAIYSEVSTAMGNKTSLILPDSSQVWLNAGSRIIYDKNFGVTHRNAQLTGEAYFEVRKAKHPFVLQANDIKVKVLGTAFNVKSYPNGNTTETSLIHGRVEITLDNRPGETFVLNPNEKLIVAKAQQATITPGKKKEPAITLASITKTEDNTVVETSWLDDRLVFQDESFGEIARMMERWYNVTIDIEDEKIESMKLTGTFTTESVKEALMALQIAFPFQFTMNQNMIIITN